MDLYILDSQFRRKVVIDWFDSLIWTERFNQFGEIQLTLPSNLESRSYIQENTMLAINGSYRVMMVDTIEDTTDVDGKPTLSVRGRSLEAILKGRIYKDTWSANATTVLTGTPGDIIRDVFDHICRAPGAISTRDELPYLQPGTIFSPGGIPEETNQIRWEQPPAELYGMIETIAKLYNLGFRLVRNFDTSELYFDVYTGTDRTTRQSVVPPVIFSVAMNNLRNTKQLRSHATAKNVAYVISDINNRIVYADGTDPQGAEGFARRAMLVIAAPDAAAPDHAAELVRAGEEALRTNAPIRMIDGEVNMQEDYQYEVDYSLGDICEVRNRDGIIDYKRITEQIFVHDGNGERSYPTLASSGYEELSTWASWANEDLVWGDMTTETWATS